MNPLSYRSDQPVSEPFKPKIDYGDPLLNNNPDHLLKLSERDKSNFEQIHNEALNRTFRPNSSLFPSSVGGDYEKAYVEVYKQLGGSKLLDLDNKKVCHLLASQLSDIKWRREIEQKSYEIAREKRKIEHQLMLDRPSEYKYFNDSDIPNYLAKRKNAHQITRLGYTERFVQYLEKELYHGNTHVDHCHKSDKIRGLLCFQCNVGLYFLQ